MVKVSSDMDEKHIYEDRKYSK